MSITPEVAPHRKTSPLRQTADEMAQVAEDASHVAKAGTERVIEAVKSGVGQVRGRTHRYAEGAREQFEASREGALETVRERPATTTAASFGVGLVAGILLARLAFAGKARAGAQAAQGGASETAHPRHS